MKNIIKNIKKDIRELKAEMKEKGIKVRSCFNGGLTREEYIYNSKLFELKTKLEQRR